MIEKLKRDIENTLEIFNEYLYHSKESDLNKLEFSLNNISAYISNAQTSSELYHTNKVISLMYNTMITKISGLKIKQDAFDILIRFLLVVLVDNKDIRLLFVNDYDMITTIARPVTLYTGEEYETEAFLESLLKVLQILSIEGFIISDEGIIDELLQFLTECLAGRRNTNIRKLASRLITNICFTYPQYSMMVLKNPSYNGAKKSLFNDVVFQVPSIMTSYMSFIIRFDSVAKQNLSANDNLLKILLFSFNTLKTEEPYLRVYTERFIESLIFDESFNLTKLGEAWSTKKYAKMSIKETLKILPTISKGSEDLSVMYRFLYNLSLNKEVRNIIYDLLMAQLQNEGQHLFDNCIIDEAFKIASDYKLNRRIPEETRINSGFFVCKMIKESIRRDKEFCSERKKKDILEYLKSLVTVPIIDIYETPEQIRLGKMVLFLKLCIMLSKDKFFINDVPKIFTTKLADQFYELQTKYTPRIKIFLRHKGEILDNKIVNAIQLTPFLLKTLNSYEKCRDTLNYILNKPDLVEFLSVGLVSKNLKLMEEVISCFEVSLPSSIKRHIICQVKNFINSEKVDIESVACSQDTMRELKEQLEDSLKVCELYKSQIDMLQEELESLKENHSKVCQEQSKKYDDLKQTMEKVSLENQLLANLKENMKNLLL
uniref:Non-specific serine/threonine protein kinase n=1 Tax=Strongyloides stercoralis TaxID=6248 RepID=A0A0K0DU81_STRER